MSHDSHNMALSFALKAAVPLQIHDFYQAGGPTCADVARAQATGRILAAYGDRLLYRSQRSGETGDLFTYVVMALAVAAFNPGGMPPLFGESTINAQTILAGFIGEEAARTYCREALQRWFSDPPVVIGTCSLQHSQTHLPVMIEMTAELTCLTDDEIGLFRAEACQVTVIDSRHKPVPLPLPVLSAWIEKSHQKELVSLLALARSKDLAVICQCDHVSVEGWLQRSRPWLFPPVSISQEPSKHGSPLRQALQAYSWTFSFAPPVARMLPVGFLHSHTSMRREIFCHSCNADTDAEISTHIEPLLYESEMNCVKCGLKLSSRSETLLVVPIQVSIPSGSRTIEMERHILEQRPILTHFLNLLENEFAMMTIVLDETGHPDSVHYYAEQGLSPWYARSRQAYEEAVEVHEKLAALFGTEYEYLRSLEREPVYEGDSYDK